MQQGTKLNMLVVCQDEKYLKSIEYRLAEALADKVDISYISDRTKCVFNPIDTSMSSVTLKESLRQTRLKQ